MIGNTPLIIDITNLYGEYDNSMSVGNSKFKFICNDDTIDVKYLGFYQLEFEVR